MTDDDGDEADSVLRGVAAAPARLPPKLDAAHADTVSFAGLAPGVLLLGRYQIVGELGRGGMGRVFAARDRRLDRDVALKILVGERNDEHAFARIEQEARAASRINHPNIATVHDVLATDHGPCIVSELLEGATLRDELAKSGARSVDEARKMGAQLAAGLTAAHERGVLHRDLKPANLFVTTDRRLKILDFGLAKLDQPHPDAPRTDDGTVLGTSGYMSPEQVRGQRVDARSDLFSAGIVLYEMLMGRRPFEGASRHEIDSRILDAAPAPLRTDIPADLAATVLRCLEKDPSRRLQSARELTAALEGTSPSASARPRRSRTWTAAAAVAAVVAVSVGAIWLAKTRQSARATPPSLAVLPFRDLSPNKDQQYLSDGIAEEVLTSLARVEGLRVAGQTSSFSLRDTTDDARTIGQKLGVGALLEGSVRLVGNRMRVSARLVNTADGYQLWSQDFDRGSADILAVEDELARHIVGALKIKLTGNRTLAANGGSPDPVAYADLLLARGQRSRGTYDDLVVAQRTIERALDRDPSFAAGWAEYGTILFQFGFQDVKEVDRAGCTALMRRASDAADKAIALDPDLPDGYILRSAVRSNGGKWDPQGALADIDHALALSPDDVRAVGRKAQLLQFFSKRYAEEIALSQRVRTLDPLNDRAWEGAGEHYYRAGKLAEARAAFTRSLELAPRGNGAELGLADLELEAGHLERALAMYEAFPDHGYVYAIVGRIMALAALHRREEAHALLVQFETKNQHDYDPTFVGWGYAALGDLDHAFAYFEKAFSYGDVALAHLFMSRWLDYLHGDPRYENLVRRMHFLDGDATAAAPRP